jgi:hypothetical protein
VWPPISTDLTPLDFFFLGGGIVKESMSNPHPKQCLKISINSKFAFGMVVNQLTCKCYPVFGMRLIIVLMYVESPNGLTLKSEKWLSKLRGLLFMLYKFHYYA